LGFCCPLLSIHAPRPAPSAGPTRRRGGLSGTNNKGNGNVNFTTAREASATTFWVAAISFPEFLESPAVELD
jgi:hypothetical protein